MFIEAFAEETSYHYTNEEGARGILDDEASERAMHLWVQRLQPQRDIRTVSKGDYPLSGKERHGKFDDMKQNAVKNHN